MSFVFIKFYIHGKLLMSSFQWSWPCLIWSYGRWDITLGMKVMQSWKILDIFFLKIHIFYSEVDIVKLFWWKLAKAFFFKVVHPDCSSSYPIGSVYCTKSSKKLPVFLKNTVKILLGFQYFCDISSVLTPILARKLSFQRENYALHDGPKFTQYNSRIKKSTFWPYSIRVLVLIVAKWFFQMLCILDSPFKHVVLIFTLFFFEIHDFAHF